MKSRLIAGDLVGAAEDARWALDAGAAESESPIGRYAAALAQLVLGEDDAAAALAATLTGAEAIPPAVIDSITTLATRDAPAYQAAIEALVADFEARSRVSRRHCGRRHGSRAPGARGGARDGRAARVGASPRSLSSACQGRPSGGEACLALRPTDRRRRARASAPSPPGSRSGTRRERRRSRARGSRRSSSRPAT